jgi:hypothetical protein
MKVMHKIYDFLFIIPIGIKLYLGGNAIKSKMIAHYYQIKFNLGKNSFQK